MKRALFVLSLALLLAGVSCTKHSSSTGNPFSGKWYVASYVEDSESQINGTGEEYWTFNAKKGTVVMHDTTFPELGGGAAPKPFTYDSESRVLVVDGFSYEVLEANSSTLRLRSNFTPEQWGRGNKIVISFQRSTRGLGNK